MGINWDADATVYMLDAPEIPSAVSYARGGPVIETTLTEAVRCVMALSAEERRKATIGVVKETAGTPNELLDAKDIEALAQHPDFPKQ